MSEISIIIPSEFSLQPASSKSKLIDTSQGNFLIFLLPILGLVKIDLIGELFTHEIILLLLFPVLLLKRSHLLSRSAAKSVLLIGLFWFISQVTTDLYQQTPVEDLIRGWAKISFFLFSFASLVMLLTTSRRILLWITASTISMFVRPFLLFAGDLDPFVLWKFGVGSALLLFACLPSLEKIFKNIDDVEPLRRIAYLHIGFGIGSFFLNARSFAGLTIFAGVLLLLYIRYCGIQIKSMALAIGCALALAGSVLIINVYSYGAASGLFGDEAQSKYEIQNAYGSGTLAVLLGGRSESLVSTQAIANSPIIGHGSWAKDFKYLIMYVDMRRAFSEDQGNPLDIDANDGLIPSHSYLLGAWVEAGLLGGLFWISILVLCIFRVIPAAFGTHSPIGVFAIMSMPMFLWNVMFSPFGANVRVEAAGTLTIFIAVLTYAITQYDLKRELDR